MAGSVREKVKSLQQESKVRRGEKRVEFSPSSLPILLEVMVMSQKRQPVQGPPLLGEVPDEA